VDVAGLIAFGAIFLIGETLAGTVIFPWIVNRFNRNTGQQNQGIEGGSGSTLIGLLERFLLFLTLLLGVQQGLTVFAALKAGSRLDEERSHKVKTEYFLVGNVVSVTMALLYFQLFPILRRWIAPLIR